MRLVALTMCLLTVACSQEAGSPTSPTSASPLAATQTAAMNAASRYHSEARSRGRRWASSLRQAPSRIRLSGDGEATHLGRFTSEEVEVGTFPSPVATGTWVFTAANGDRLFATTESIGTPVGPNIDDVKTVATITGGTGRFADAKGTFTSLIRGSHDPSTGEGEFAGSFSGHLSLNH